MRTVDPAQWWRGARPPALALTRPWRFGATRHTSFEWRVRRSFSTAMQEMGTHCTMQCVRGKTNPRHAWERWVLRIFLVGGFVLFGITIAERFSSASLPKLTVRLVNSQHPISKISFPGVAICSYNLLSLKALWESAAILEVAENLTDYGTEYLVDSMRGLAALFQMNPHMIYDDLLELLEKWPRSKYNISSLLLECAPQCDMMLYGCSWRGEETVCEDLFKPRITAQGYCCVFNGRYLPGDIGKPSYTLDMVGEDSGLTVFVQDDFTDFAWGTKPINGVEVMVFSGEQFPLIEAGGLHALPASRGAALQLRVRVVDQRADDSLRYFGRWANCHVYGPRNKKNLGRHELSSFSHCVADCRRRAALALCGCVPPGQLPGRTDPTCSLVDIACLHKHQGKFLFFLPPDFASYGTLFLQEQQDALDCDCLPECARPHYSVTVSDVTPQYLDTTHYFISDGDNFPSNTTKLQFFYSSVYQELNSVEPTHFGRHVYAYFGGMYYLLTGSSLLAVCEFFYFCTIQFITHLINSYRKPSHIA